jgi:hypothetical protein
MAGEEGGLVPRVTGRALAKQAIPHRKALSALKEMGYSVHKKSAKKASAARVSFSPWIKFVKKHQAQKPAGMLQSLWLQRVSKMYHSASQ